MLISKIRKLASLVWGKDVYLFLQQRDIIIQVQLINRTKPYLYLHLHKQPPPMLFLGKQKAVTGIKCPVNFCEKIDVKYYIAKTTEIKELHEKCLFEKYENKSSYLQWKPVS